MNKLNKSAYMFLIWAAFLCCGCGGAQRTKMYLEASVQDERESGTGQDTSALEKSPDVLEDGSLPEQEETQSCFVYVCGAVKRPGVYELPKGSRVYEALALAGGLRKDAYEKEINQAEPVEDGQMIEVFTIKEHKTQQEHQRQTQKSQQTDSPDSAYSDDRIDINTASKEQLMTLSGIGEAKADNIIDYRERIGGFSAPAEIMDVNGIGEGLYARIQDKITVIQ